jgi:hypothetical protein
MDLVFHDESADLLEQVGSPYIDLGPAFPTC